MKVLPGIFFRTASGSEPVREWLKELDKEDRAIIGKDIKTVEFGWPVGMPICRSITGRKDLWEVRSKLTRGRIARVLFFTHNGKMVLLHGFVKKTQKIPESDLDLAMKRKKEYENNDKTSQ
ncbi:MAG: type II toxin-antitoxin system RelE/ParE family toxin [Symploca sp. SIO2E9]|nr:type II toxin-antitoxin system RelE/ParE family toxin [Symploca sp. SIO2E9]